MAFTIGSGTFTNGSATVTGVTLTSGTLAYFASGTRMVVGVNPVIQEVEAIAAPTVSTITLRSAWTGTGGTYSFLANQTSEGLRDAVQAIRTNNASLQSFIDSIDTAATADSVAQRTSDGSLNVNQLNATSVGASDIFTIGNDSGITVGATQGGGASLKYNSNGNLDITPRSGFNTVFTSGNVGIGTSPATKLDVSGAIRASTGILFGSDTAAANTLDDYEEGTWTPSIDGYGGGYTTREGNYTKIGDRVFGTFLIKTDGNGGSLVNTFLQINAPFVGTGGSLIQIGSYYNLISGISSLQSTGLPFGPLDSPGAGSNLFFANQQSNSAANNLNFFTSQLNSSSVIEIRGAMQYRTGV